MTTTATILDFDKFRVLREVLGTLRRPTDNEVEGPKVVDWYLPGFIGKARVTTAFGELPIEALRPRDDLRTFSGISARVQVVDKIHLDQDFLRHHASALPIRIPANAFGPGRPLADLLVSPGQEVSPDAHVATSFSLARALSNRFTLDLSMSTGLTYYRFHCGVPTIIKVNGLWVRIQPWQDCE